MRARTMIYLDVEQHRALRTEAVREGVSMAEVLRRLVGRYLDERRGSGRVPPKAYLRLVGLGASGRSDISERHDAYLTRALRRDRAR
jgi:hypothetical protein